MYVLYVFILQSVYNSTCFERPFLSSSGVYNLLYPQLCTDHSETLKKLLLIYIDKSKVKMDKVKSVVKICII